MKNDAENAAYKQGRMNLEMRRGREEVLRLLLAFLDLALQAARPSLYGLRKANTKPASLRSAEQNHDLQKSCAECRRNQTMNTGDIHKWPS